MTTTEKVLVTYKLELIGPMNAWPTPDVLIDTALQFGRGILEAEENLTDLLPDGYRVRIEDVLPEEVGK